VFWAALWDREGLIARVHGRKGGCGCSWPGSGFVAWGTSCACSPTPHLCTAPSTRNPLPDVSLLSWEYPIPFDRPLEQHAHRQPSPVLQLPKFQLLHPQPPSTQGRTLINTPEFTSFQRSFLPLWGVIELLIKQLEGVCLQVRGAGAAGRCTAISPSICGLHKG